MRKMTAYCGSCGQKLPQLVSDQELRAACQDALSEMSGDAREVYRRMAAVSANHLVNVEFYTLAAANLVEVEVLTYPDDVEGVGP